MPKFSTIISFLFITTTIAHAGGEKEVLFPELTPGLHLYRYNWDVETCVLYVAEMSRTEPTLHFEVALANAQVLGKEDRPVYGEPSQPTRGIGVFSSQLTAVSESSGICAAMGAY